MALITVAKMAAEMGLRNLTPDIDAEERKIIKADINRPALPLVGYYDNFVKERVQIIGYVESLGSSTVTGNYYRNDGATDATGAAITAIGQEPLLTYPDDDRATPVYPDSGTSGPTGYSSLVVLGMV